LLFPCCELCTSFLLASRLIAAYGPLRGAHCILPSGSAVMVVLVWVPGLSRPQGLSRRPAGPPPPPCVPAPAFSCYPPPYRYTPSLGPSPVSPLCHAPASFSAPQYAAPPVSLPPQVLQLLFPFLPPQYPPLSSRPSAAFGASPQLRFVSPFTRFPGRFLASECGGLPPFFGSHPRPAFFCFMHSLLPLTGMASLSLRYRGSVPAWRPFICLVPLSPHRSPPGHLRLVLVGDSPLHPPFLLAPPAPWPPPLPPPSVPCFCPTAFASLHYP